MYIRGIEQEQNIQTVKFCKKAKVFQEMKAEKTGIPCLFEATDQAESMKL